MILQIVSSPLDCTRGRSLLPTPSSTGMQPKATTELIEFQRFASGERIGEER